MRAVNLLPREIARQRKPLLGPQNAPALVGAGLGVVVIGALGLGYLHESGAVSSAQNKLAAVKAELAATPKPAQPSTQPQSQANAQLSSEQTALTSAVSTALGGRVAWDRILREFSLVLPDDVWLSNLAVTMPAAGSATGTITISGSTYSNDSVARLLARLALVPELADVSLTSDSAGGATATPGATTGSTSGGGIVTFTITANVTLPAGAASVTAPPPAAPPPASTGTTTTGASS